MMCPVSRLIAALGIVAALPASADELSLAYFMGPMHPMNAAVFTPFQERLAEASGGELTVRQYPGGALNSVPPQQYNAVLEGVADIVFALPGYTGETFPMTNVISLPGVCDGAVDCTEALLNARPLIEQEYDARLLAVWANDTPVLITRDRPVRRLEDLAGMIIRVTAQQSVPFTEALGASAVAQPVNVLNQNLANGVIDAIVIGASAIRSFNLHEVGRYVTTWYPGSGAAFVLLMNQGVYDGLDPEQQGWIDAAADASLSILGGEGFDASARSGLALASDAGLEIIDLPDAERARWMAALEEPLATAKAEQIGTRTVEEIVAVMRGE